MNPLTLYRQMLRAAFAAALLLLVMVLLVMLAGRLAGWVPLAVLLGVVVLLGLLRVWLRRRVARRTILEVDFERGIVEQVPADPLGRLALRQYLTVRTVVDALRRAAGDTRIVGLLARIGPGGIGLAHAQEIREAIADFRKEGKKAIAWCQTLGEGHNAAVEYCLASSFDEIHLQPSGEVGLNGLMVHQPFLRGLFDRLGVVPRMDHRRQYKAAKYIFTEEQMPEPHRESFQTLLESQAAQIAAGIAQSRGDRGLDESAVRELMERGPFFAHEALEAKLVDHLSFRDEVYEKAKKDLDGKLLDLEQYLARIGPPNARGEQVALIHGVGAITRGRSRSRRLPPGAVMGSDDVTAAFRAAIEDKRVRAIVFRVDSPGGSVVASEAVWREVKRARAAGKPVIVSMSTVAGSGGYYVAMAADKIVALPGTITGSIGVVFGKLVTADAWRKVGVNWQSVQVGANAGIWSSGQDFSPPQWEKVQTFLDAVYEDFKQKVAEGRHLTAEQVEAAAQGRIWTGEQARAHGLVDELGGLDRAIALAREAAQIPADKGVQLVAFPRRRRLAMLAAPPESSEAAAAAVQETVQLLAPFAEAWAAANPARDGVLSMERWIADGGQSGFRRDIF